MSGFAAPGCRGKHVPGPGGPGSRGFTVDARWLEDHDALEESRDIVETGGDEDRQYCQLGSTETSPFVLQSVTFLLERTYLTCIQAATPRHEN